MCQHPARQVNVSRKGVLCAPDYGPVSDAVMHSNKTAGP